MTTPTTETTATERITLHPVVIRLLEKRGLDRAGIEEFLSWDLKHLPDLTAMKDLSKAAKRICDALDAGEQIGVYGDYDVDGTTSCALLGHFFKTLNHEATLVQPSRFIEGYGIHPPAIDQAISSGVKVLITVDCGISNNEAAEYANERGLDLIITDHHKDARDVMPPAFAVVNPNRRDEPKDSPLCALAGVGVAFALALEIKNELAKRGRTTPSLYHLLQFVAIGTICDMAHLNPMNMKLVRHGLKQLPKSEYPGIRQFFSPEERERDSAPSEKLSFSIGPMINSKGRLDHPERALLLLMAKNSDEAFENYAHLEISNRERKLIQEEVFKAAKEQIAREVTTSDHKISIAYAPEWHEGVIGIVASKLVENFKAPAVVFTDTEDKNLIKASARSAGDMSIFDALKACEDLFTKFGGHKAAAGLSMPKDNLPEFKRRMNLLMDEIPASLRTAQENYDLDIAPSEINPKLARELNLLEPFGMGNKKPVFRMTNFDLVSYDLLKEVHVRWNLAAKGDQKNFFRGISFNYIGKWGLAHPEDLILAQKRKDLPLTAYFTLGINRWNGSEFVQLMVDKIEF
jgi:single-stranded-DNA-specific exonuclease